jgi:hypothetical protein
MEEASNTTKTGELLANNHLLFKICAMIELEKLNCTRCRAVIPPLALHKVEV